MWSPLCSFRSALGCSRYMPSLLALHIFSGTWSLTGLVCQCFAELYRCVLDGHYTNHVFFRARIV